MIAILEHVWGVLTNPVFTLTCAMAIGFVITYGRGDCS
jgi:hypothetical protein